MSLHEVDDLLKRSFKLIRKSKLPADHKRALIWNLERLPNRYDMDAGGYDITETGDNVTPVIAHALGKAVVEEAHHNKDKNLIYDWSSFLLNYFDYFKEDASFAILKKEYMGPIRAIYQQYNFEGHKASHRSLEVYEEIDEDMEEWFSKQQVELMQWFVE